jgi:hypothetical protein
MKADEVELNRLVRRLMVLMNPLSLTDDKYLNNIVKLANIVFERFLDSDTCYNHDLNSHLVMVLGLMITESQKSLKTAEIVINELLMKLDGLNCLNEE